VNNSYIGNLCLKLSNLLPQEWLVELSEQVTCQGKNTPIRVNGLIADPQKGRDLICLIYHEGSSLVVHSEDSFSPKVRLTITKIKEAIEGKLLPGFRIKTDDCSLECESCRQAAPFYEEMPVSP